MLTIDFGWVTQKNENETKKNCWIRDLRSNIITCLSLTDLVICLIRYSLIKWGNRFVTFIIWCELWLSFLWNDKRRIKFQAGNSKKNWPSIKWIGSWWSEYWFDSVNKGMYIIVTVLHRVFEFVIIINDIFIFIFLISFHNRGFL